MPQRFKGHIEVLRITIDAWLYFAAFTNKERHWVRLVNPTACCCHGAHRAPARAVPASLPGTHTLTRIRSNSFLSRVTKRRSNGTTIKRRSVRESQGRLETGTASEQIRRCCPCAPQKASSSLSFFERNAYPPACHRRGTSICRTTNHDDWFEAPDSLRHHALLSNEIDDHLSPSWTCRSRRHRRAPIRALERMPLIV